MNFGCWLVSCNDWTNKHPLVHCNHHSTQNIRRSAVSPSFRHSVTQPSNQAPACRHWTARRSAHFNLNHLTGLYIRSPLGAANAATAFTTVTALPPVTPHTSYSH
ncbi:unnamed protein product [Ceratitis capitata]|uniref:(Mediterranean fruit fly) hypothetical protein n=1 Tax=Ceratitis capitata TaxID=7213 RepID=A0A811UMC1_CERCA|nr:unnamed protein product [Ceratitis capitata]